MLFLRMLKIRPWRVFVWVFALVWAVSCVATWNYYEDLTTFQRVFVVAVLALLSPDIETLFRNSNRATSIESLPMKSMRPRILVAEIRHNQISLHDPANGSSVEHTGNFSSESRLIESAEGARLCMKVAIKDLLRGQLVQSPWLVIHPRESSFDADLLKALGHEVGAARVALSSSEKRLNIQECEAVFVEQRKS